MLNRRRPVKPPTSETEWFDAWMAKAALDSAEDAEALAIAIARDAEAAKVNLARVMQFHGYKSVRDLLLDRLDDRNGQGTGQGD